MPALAYNLDVDCAIGSGYTAIATHAEGELGKAREILGDSMKLLAFSDFHVHPFDVLRRAVDQEEPDAVLFAGDGVRRLLPLASNIFVRTSRGVYEVVAKGKRWTVRGYSKDTRGTVFEGSAARLDEEVTREISWIHWPHFRPPAELSVPIFCVSGNDDVLVTEDEKYFVQAGCMRRKDIFALNGIRCDGFEVLVAVSAPVNGRVWLKTKGETVSVFGFQCPFGMEREISNAKADKADIYLSHLPPKGVLDLSMRYRVAHIGSRKLRRWVEEFQPKILVCGHAHFWGGKAATIGRTQVVNVSSSGDRRRIRDFNYAVVDTNGWEVRLRKTSPFPVVRGVTTVDRTLRDIERTAWGSEHRSMAKCKAIGKARNEVMHWKCGRLFSVGEVETLLGQLKNNKYATARLKRDVGRVERRCASLGWDRPRIVGRMKDIRVDAHNIAFVDVETGVPPWSESRPPWEPREPATGQLWLIGVWYRDEIVQYECPAQMENFTSFVGEKGISRLVSWTGYDKVVLQPLLREAGLNPRFHDACRKAATVVEWYTYSLHDLYRALFPDDPDTDEPITGAEAGIYADHIIIPKRQCQYCPPRASLAEVIKERNRQDLLQMVAICRKLSEAEPETSADPVRS